MRSYIDKSPENIQRIKELAEKNTLGEVARITGRSVEGIRDFLIRHDALPENRKVRYRKAAAKKYITAPKRCVDCGKELFWAKIYYKEIRCQKCGHKKYFDELRASKPVKQKQAKIKPFKKLKVKIVKVNEKKFINTIDKRIKFLEKEIRESQRELDFKVC